MIGRASLLDLMAIKVGCSYLSDLKYIDESKRFHLAMELKKVPAKDEDYSDWNDALEYFSSGTVSCSSAEQAKESLIAVLSSPHSEK